MFDSEVRRIVGALSKDGEENLDLLENGVRFAHYTSADTAKSIIENQSVWLRNVSMMNDFSEIEHGWNFLMESLDSGEGQKFKQLVESIGEDVWPEAAIEDWRNNKNKFLLGTYICCLSKHQSSEDKYGRLSMWRAYGGDESVAIVFKNDMFMKYSEKMGVFSVPVSYRDLDEASGLMTYRNKNLSQMIEDQIPLDNIRFKAMLHETFRETILGTKHPGFREEQEWRVYLVEGEAGGLATAVKKIEPVNGVPQYVYELPFLEADPVNRIGIALKDSLDCILIGPSSYPHVLYQVFVELLEKAGVEEAEKKVRYSNIPLR